MPVSNLTSDYYHSTTEPDKCRHSFIPSDVRPHIWVKVLPALENILYGANLSNILSKHQFVILDVLAWLPYGIIHFGAPAACSLAMFFFAAPGTVPVFSRSFGYMNLIGVAIQITFPCSPPWYENLHGLAPADYSMEGSPAGLARIDQLFGVDVYTTNFINSPMVFGAFPSLHAASAVMEALFMSYCFPRFRPLFAAYTMWLWWATMYLSHHYAVDLVGGSMISAIIFYIARANFLPRLQSDKVTRWDYDYVEIGNRPVGSQAYDLAEMGYRNGRLSNDEWTLGSSSSITSSSTSPLGDDNQSLWEGETLAERDSDRESQLSEVVYGDE
jgi:membrane-associated phospholipid phosphatase